MNLKQLRQSKNKTQKQLSEILNVSRSWISKIENTKDISISTLRKYIEALGGDLEIDIVLPGERIKIL